MEMLKKFKNRIVPLVLAVVIFATSVVSGPASLTAQASVAVSEEFSVELSMLLYNILETVAISTGIKDGLDDYNSGSSLYDAFISFMDSASTPSYLRDTYITMQDGTQMTLQEAIDAAGATSGSNALKLPKEEVFAKYRTISGGKNPESSPTPSPTPSKDDDVVVLDKFHEIAFILVSSPMLVMCTKFFEVIQNGGVPEVDPAKYYDGLLSSDFNYYCNYIYDNTGSWPSRYALYYSYTGSTKELCYVYDLSDTRTIVSGCTGLSCDQVKVYLLYVTSDDSVDNKQEYFYIDGHFDQYDGSKLYRVNKVNHQSTTCYSVFYPGLAGQYINVDSLDTDMKIFNSLESFRSYCKSGDVTGQLNSVPYDYHSMTAAAPDTLENLSGTKLDPAKVPAMNNAMKEAANGVEATGTDKEANNAEMIAAVKAAVAEALAEAQPDPAPEPTAAPDPEPSIAPDPDAGTGTYSGILGLILSAIQAIASQIWDYFSHPFGSIIEGITNIVELLPKVNELVQALPASIFGFFQVPLDLITSGITNLYNGVLRIIELLPEQVQLVLGNIVSLPSAMLQAFADPLGAIQSLLGALPSWANLQGYLDKILDALVDPGSLLEPSNPGGEDPGGDGSGGGSKFNLLSLLNGLIYLILILILLLKIFIHCLQFIINIFKIEASPGFLPDEMVMGLNFLKQIEITGIGLSIYDFMMGLVYILMVFGVVKLLRGYAYKIHIPSGGGK